MRQPFFTFFLLAFLLLLTACHDEDPKNYLEVDEAYADANSLYINAVASLYNYIGGEADSQGLQGTGRGVYDYNTFTTDEAIVPTRGGDWYDGGYWQNLYLHQWTEDDSELYETWKYLYKVVTLCNRSLQRLDEYANLLTTQELTKHKAEVRAIRAMYYYYLMDMFGRIPIVTNNNTPANEVKQSKRSEAFQFIVDELQEVAMSLTDNHSNKRGEYYGRITRPVAFFLLAKLALNAPIYTDDDWTDDIIPDGRDIDFPIGDVHMNAYKATIAYCEMLTASGYRLEEFYEDNFTVANETSWENIFTIPMDKLLFTTKFDNIARSCHYNHGAAIGLDGLNGPSATITTVKTFGYGTDDIDKRYYINFYSDTIAVGKKVITLDDGTPLVYHPLEMEIDLSGSPYEKTAGARMAKYEIDNNTVEANDIVLFRFGDAILMKAEALIRNGEDGFAIINLIRERAGMDGLQGTGSQEADLSTILDERLRELVWEGWRRQDLIRFGRFHLPYDLRPQLPKERNRYTIVFPIPQTALDLNHNLTQNPGY